MTSPFFAPAAALAGLTVAVWALALYRRIGEIRARRIPVQSLARARDTAHALDDTRAMDNFNNLLQVPVLFHVLCLWLALAGETGTAFLAGAWAYVALRAVHSAIQVTYNRVIHRFQAWMLGNFVLFVLWGAHAAQTFIR